MTLTWSVCTEVLSGKLHIGGSTDVATKSWGISPFLTLLARSSNSPRLPKLSASCERNIDSYFRTGRQEPRFSGNDLYAPGIASDQEVANRYKLSLSSCSKAWSHSKALACPLFHGPFGANKKRLQQSIKIVTAEYLRNAFATPAKVSSIPSCRSSDLRFSRHSVCQSNSAFPVSQ